MLPGSDNLRSIAGEAGTTLESVPLSDIIDGTAHGIIGHQNTNSQSQPLNCIPVNQQAQLVEPFVWEDSMDLGAFESINSSSTNDNDDTPELPPLPSASDGQSQNPPSGNVPWNSRWDDDLVAGLDLQEKQNSERANSTEGPSRWTILPACAFVAALSIESDDLESETKNPKT
jgi:hypothetical protein